MSSRPVIGLLGLGPGWTPDPAVQVPYDFRTIFGVTTSNWRAIASEYQAVIVSLNGMRADDPRIQGLNWRYLADGTKVGMWSVDSHHDAWHVPEADAAREMTAFFTAHSEWAASIGPNVHWVPCGCPRVPEIVERGRYALRPDIVSAAVPYLNDRDRTIFDIHARLRASEISYIIGVVQKSMMLPFYAAARSVLNVNQTTDLNIRQFEALSVGTPVIMTPAHDWKHSRFDSLRPFTVEIPRSPTLEHMRAALAKIAVMDATPAIAEVRSKHTVMHRYAEMAEILLSR